MSRIIAYEEKAQIAADDYLVIDSSTDGTRKIKASLLADGYINGYVPLVRQALAIGTT